MSDIADPDPENPADPTPGPSAAAKASASTIFGNASAMSVMRISTLSTKPPQ